MARDFVTISCKIELWGRPFLPNSTPFPSERRSPDDVGATWRTQRNCWTSWSSPESTVSETSSSPPSPNTKFSPSLRPTATRRPAISLTNPSAAATTSATFCASLTT